MTKKKGIINELIVRTTIAHSLNEDGLIKSIN